MMRPIKIIQEKIIENAVLNGTIRQLQRLSSQHPELSETVILANQLKRQYFDTVNTVIGTPLTNQKVWLMEIDLPRNDRHFQQAAQRIDSREGSFIVLKALK